MSFGKRHLHSHKQAMLAGLLGVSHGFFKGNSELNEDSSTTNRLMERQQLSNDEKNSVFKLVDAFLRDLKAKKAHAS